MSELNPYASPKFETGEPLTAADYKPPTVLGAIGRGTTLYVQCFPTVAAITLIVWVPLELFVSYQNFYVLDPEDAMAAVRLATMADWFVGIIATSGVISVGAAAMLGERRSWLQGLGDGLRAWPRMFGTRLLVGLCVFVALLLFVLPGIYLAVRLVLAESVAVIERRGGTYAIGRSQELTRGRFWSFFAITAFIVGISFGVGVLVELPFEFIPAMNHWLVSAGMGCLVDLAVAWLIMIYVAAYFATIDEERQRREIAAASAAAKGAMLSSVPMPPGSDYPPSPARDSAAPFS